MPEKYLTVKEAADRLRVHDRTVRAYLRKGTLTKYVTNPTRRVRLDEAEVEAMVQTQAPAVTGAGS